MYTCVTLSASLRCLAGYTAVLLIVSLGHGLAVRPLTIRPLATVQSLCVCGLRATYTYCVENS
jgi:hypothetical protein